MTPVPARAGLLATAAVVAPVAVGMVPPRYLVFVSAACGCAALIAAVLPPAAAEPKTVAEKVYAAFRNVVDFAGHNYGSVVPAVKAPPAA